MEQCPFLPKMINVINIKGNINIKKNIIIRFIEIIIRIILWS